MVSKAGFVTLMIRAEVLKAIDSKTIAVFAETITNPQLEVVDLLELSAVAHEKERTIDG